MYKLRKSLLIALASVVATSGLAGCADASGDGSESPDEVVEAEVPVEPTDAEDSTELIGDAEVDQSQENAQGSEGGDAENLKTELPPEFVVSLTDHCEDMQALSNKRLNRVPDLATGASDLLGDIARFPDLEGLVEPVSEFIEYASWVEEVRKVETALYAVDLQDNKGVEFVESLNQAAEWDLQRGDDLRVSSFETARSDGSELVPARPQSSSSIETLYVVGCAQIPFG